MVSSLFDLRCGRNHCFRVGLVSMSAALKRTKGSVLLYDNIIIRQGIRVTRPTLEPSSHAEGWRSASTVLVSSCFPRILSRHRALGSVLPASDLDPRFDTMVAELLISGAVRTRICLRSCSPETVFVQFKRASSVEELTSKTGRSRGPLQRR